MAQAVDLAVAGAMFADVGTPKFVRAASTVCQMRRAGTARPVSLLERSPVAFNARHHLYEFSSVDDG
jgi:hypothetical protein